MSDSQDRYPISVDEQLYFLHAVIDHIANPVFYKDAHGRFMGCNRAFTTATGLSCEQVLGRTVFDLLPRAEAEAMDRKDRALLAAGGIQVYRATVTNPQSGPWPVLVHKAVFQRLDGQVGGTVTSLIDLTEQYQAEERLLRSQALLSTISQNVQDLMALTDRAGKRQFTSPSYATTLGFTPEELEAMPPLGLVHPEDQAILGEALALLFRGGPAQTLEYRMRHRDGRWLPFEVRAVLTEPKPGEEPRALTVAREVSARKAAELAQKNMEVQLRHAQKLEAIGSLAAGIAHEINTPTQYIGDNASFLRDALAGVMGFVAEQRRFLEDHQHLEALRGPAAEALRRFADLDLDYLAAEIPRAIQETLEGVARVTRIVSAMKDFSHPGTDTKVPVDLNQSIENTLVVARNEYKYVAELETALDPGLPPVPCYKGEINQAVLNLVVNAAHAIEERYPGQESGRGLIRVSTRLDGPEVVITISDNGAGIEPAVCERMFEPFFTTKPVGKGTGQGLAIVHAVVVEKHGGRVSVESEPGRGSSFHLHLPMAGRGEDA